MLLKASDKQKKHTYLYVCVYVYVVLFQYLQMLERYCFR